MKNKDKVLPQRPRAVWIRYECYECFGDDPLVGQGLDRLEVPGEPSKPPTCHLCQKPMSLARPVLDEGSSEDGTAT